jgi:hypothetical protein
MNYQKVYNQIIERAKNRQLEGYKEKHHIIPKCLGGNNDKENLVDLTAREHFLCHMLLCEIYPKENKLKQALWLMIIGKNSRNKHNISSRNYEYNKIKFIDTIKGKKLSNITKEKIKRSRLLLGNLSKYYTPEVKDKISSKLKNRKHTWGDKISKAKTGKTRSINWGDKISKAKTGKTKKGKEIIQICPKTLTILNTYNSISDAIKNTKTKGIPNALRGISKTSGGYIWKYKN